MIFTDEQLLELSIYLEEVDHKFQKESYEGYSAFCNYNVEGSHSISIEYGFSSYEEGRVTYFLCKFKDFFLVEEVYDLTYCEGEAKEVLEHQFETFSQFLTFIKDRINS